MFIPEYFRVYLEVISSSMDQFNSHEGKAAMDYSIAK